MKGDKLKCGHWNSGCRIFPTFGDPLKQLPDSCRDHKGITKDKHYSYEQLVSYMAPNKLAPVSSQQPKQKGKNKLDFLLEDNTPYSIEQTSTFDFNAAIQLLDHDPEKLDDHDCNIHEL